MDTPSVPQKRCYACGVFQPISSFNKDKTSKDGLQAKCRLCQKITDHNRYWSNPEKERERTKQYAKEHSEKRRETKRNTRAKKPDVYRNSAKLWRAKNRDKVRRIHQLDYQRHTDEYKRRAQKNRIENPDVKRSSEAKRRARKRQSQTSYTVQDIKRQYEAQKGCCYYCHKHVGKTYHADHVIPLSRGGSNGPENIVIACEHCNCSKKSKMPHEWPEGGRLL